MSAKHTDAELECCEEHIVHTDAVMAARSAMPAEEITTAASDFFKAFSDKTRLRILAALVSAELLTQREGQLLLSACSDGALAEVDKTDRDRLRAAIYRCAVMGVATV